MRNRSRMIVVFVLPLVLILLVVSLFFWQQNRLNTAAEAPQATATPKPLNKLTLALDFTPNPNHTGVYVAQQKGWYREAGIDLHILPFSQNSFPDTLVTQGQADVAFSSTETIVLDAAKNQPIVSLAAILSHNTSVLVTRDDGSIKRPKDLDGKKFGSYGAPYEVPIVSTAIKHDGGKGNFKNIILGTDAIQAVITKQVDFAWVFGLDVEQARAQGAKLKTFSVTEYGVPDYYAPNLVSSEKTIKEKHDLLQTFMEITQRGYDYASKNPEEATKLLIAGAPQGTFSDEKQLEQGQRFASSHYEDEGMKWGVQDAKIWKAYVDFILKTNSVTDDKEKPVKALDSTKLFTNEFVK